MEHIYGKLGGNQTYKGTIITLETNVETQINSISSDLATTKISIDTKDTVTLNSAKDYTDTKVSTKQDKLNATNLKTINGNSLLGAGDIKTNPEIVVYDNFSNIFLQMEPNTIYALFNQISNFMPLPKDYSPLPGYWEEWLPPLGEYKLEISVLDSPVEVILALPKDVFIINSNQEIEYGSTIINIDGDMNADTIILPANSRVSVSILLDTMLIYFWEK